MICKYCGADIQEGAAFCTSCGATVEISQATETIEIPAEETVVLEETPVSTSKVSKGLGIASMVCSIVAPFGGCVYCCGGVPGFLLWIASIVTAIISNVQAKKNGQKKSGFAKAGLIIAIVYGSLVALAGIAVLVLYLIYGVAVFAAVGLEDTY